MPVYKYLDISTGNLPEAEWRALTDPHATGEAAEYIDRLAEQDFPHPRVISHEYGAWVHVPEIADEFARANDAVLKAVMPTFHRVLAHARERDCNWLNVDQDAEEEPGLPVFDW